MILPFFTMSIYVGLRIKGLQSWFETVHFLFFFKENKLCKSLRKRKEKERVKTRVNEL